MRSNSFPFSWLLSYSSQEIRHIWLLTGYKPECILSLNIGHYHFLWRLIDQCILTMSILPDWHRKLFTLDADPINMPEYRRYSTACRLLFDCFAHGQWRSNLTVDAVAIVIRVKCTVLLQRCHSVQIVVIFQILQFDGARERISVILWCLNPTVKTGIYFAKLLPPQKSLLCDQVGLIPR